MDWLLRQVGSWFDLVLEAKCPLCQRSTPQLLCQDCETRLQHCRLKQQAQWQPPLPVFAWGDYRGMLKQAIAALKYHNTPQMARLLGDWLAESWLAAQIPHPKRLIVVPIPMHAAKLKQRGFNQADLIAQAFCQRTGFSLQSQGLLRSRETTAQFSLTATAREENLKDAFEIGKGLSGKKETSVLLVDDIYTTGATARSAVQTLHRHQIRVCGLVAVARAEHG